jgi:hypothetical protein
VWANGLTKCTNIVLQCGQTDKLSLLTNIIQVWLQATTPSKRAADSQEDVPTPSSATKRCKDVVINLDSDESNINQRHFGNVLGAINAMMGHPVFKNIKTDDPLTIDKKAPKFEQGTGAHFNNADHNTIGSGYTAKCNLMWINVFGSVVPGVPINSGAVEGLKNHFFKNPVAGGYPMTVRVAVSTGQDVLASKGNLVSLSPLELAHALILRIGEEITAGADNARLKAWRQMVLTCTIAFETMDSNDDRHWRSVELRENEGTVGVKSWGTRESYRCDVVLQTSRCHGC